MAYTKKLLDQILNNNKEINRIFSRAAEQVHEVLPIRN